MTLDIWKDKQNSIKLRYKNDDIQTNTRRKISSPKQEFLLSIEP